MNTVSKGLEIVFISTPYQETIPPDIHMSGEMEQVCENEVTSLLLKGAVTETSDTDGFFSALFVIPKKSGGFRPIVNLKGLNSFVCYEHFKMERLDSVKFLLKKGDWLVNLDLGRVPFGTHPSKPPKIPSLSVEKETFSIPLSAFRFIFRSPCLYKDNESSGGLSKRARHSTYHLSG